MKNATRLLLLSVFSSASLLALGCAADNGDEREDQASESSEVRRVGGGVFRFPRPSGGADAGSGGSSSGGSSSGGSSSGGSSSGGAILFQDGFESGGMGTTQNGVRWNAGVDTAITTAKPKTGTRSLSFTFSAVPNGQDSFSEQGFELGGNYPDLWVKYDLLIPANYAHRNQSGSTNNKGFLYLWSGDYGNPNGPGLGPNFWPNGDGSSNHSFYIWGPRLDMHVWDAAPESIALSDRGKWITVICHYKYATSAGKDGVAEIWKRYSDGTTKKIQNIQNGPWYVAGQKGFDRGYVLGWANAGFSEKTVFYMDNFVVATKSLL